MSDLQLSLSWGLDSSASPNGLGVLAAMVKVDCVPIDGASVGGWVHIRREKLLIDTRKRRRMVWIPISDGGEIDGGGWRTE